MPKPRIVKLHLTDIQIRTLGLFAAHWAFLENEISFMLTALGVQVNKSQDVPFHFGDKVKLWKKCARKLYSKPRLYKQITKIIEDVKKAHKLRAILLHGKCVGDPKKQDKRIYVEHHRHKKDEWFVQPYLLEPERIRKWAREIGRISSRLRTFNVKNLRVSHPVLPYRLSTIPIQTPPLIRRL